MYIYYYYYSTWIFVEKCGDFWKIKDKYGTHSKYKVPFVADKFLNTVTKKLFISQPTIFTIMNFKNWIMINLT